MKKIMITTIVSTIALLAQGPIIHDAEYSILEAQNGKKWKEDDKNIDNKLVFNFESKKNMKQITGTVDEVMEHIYDSVFPVSFLPKIETALDIGTGAGFPGRSAAGRAREPWPPADRGSLACPRAPGARERRGRCGSRRRVR